MLVTVEHLDDSEKALYANQIRETKVFNNIIEVLQKNYKTIEKISNSFFALRLKNGKPEETGVRVELQYIIYENTKKKFNVITHTFFYDQTDIVESTAYVIDGNLLIEEFYSDSMLLKDNQGYSSRKWNGDAIVSFRNFEMKNGIFYNA